MKGDAQEDLDDMMKRILIVDDERLIAFGLVRALRDNFIHVNSVGTGQKALEEVTAADYDLCFVDLGLPDMSGLDLIQEIRRVSPRTKVVVMTASILSGESARTVESIADQQIGKPFDLLEIKTMVGSMLSQPS